MPVLTERDGGVCVITLDRPEARNAMNAEMAAATVEAIESAQESRAIVLTGRDPAFCAGLDLRQLGVERLLELAPFVAATAASQVPVVAAVNGPAVTGGLELALACDFIIASERATFADTHLRVGVYPGSVLVELPRRVGMAWAREMSLTGDFVDAATALRIGLANHVVAHDDLLPVALAKARSICDQDPDMVRTARQDWVATDRLPLPEAHRLHLDTAATSGFTESTGRSIADRRAAVVERAHRQ